MAINNLPAALQFVSTLNTSSLAAFEDELVKSSLNCLPVMNTQGIDWWNATKFPKNTCEKTQLVAAAPAGSAQDACKSLLGDFCNTVSLNDSPSKYIAPGPTSREGYEFSRAGWFDYYCSEAIIGDKTPVEKKALELTINALYYKSDGQVIRKIDFDRLPNNVLLSILTQCMVTGFKKIPATAKQAIAGNSVDVAILAKLLWAGDPTEVAGSQIRSVPIECKWRGDSRSYQAVKSSQGFLTKSASAGYARGKNLSAPWHPMSIESNKQYLWFRKGQNDNCLYSVVSVGKSADWKTYLPYPLIKLSGGSVANMSNFVGLKKLKCVPSTGGAAVVLDIPVTETYLYFFVFAGLALDTGAMQGNDAYPEIGVSGIPMRNVFGAVRFLQFHLGDAATVTDDAGVLCVRSSVDKHDDNAATIRSYYGETFLNTIGPLFQQVAGLASPLCVKWSGSGAGYLNLQPFNTEFTYGGAQYKVARQFIASN